MFFQLSSFLLISVGVFCGCVEKENTQHQEPALIAIDTLYRFTNFETHDIAQPTNVKILSNELIAVADYATQIVTLLNSESDIITTFGRQGRGPGEFLNIRDLFETGNKIAVHDSHQNNLLFFSYDGELLKAHSLPSIAMNKDFTLINDSLYVIGMEGLDGHLLQLQSLNSDYVFSFGKPKAERGERVDMVKSQNQLKARQIPDFFKNKISLKSDGEYIYVFFETLSEMQKYDLDGNLIWEKKIELPNNERIFEGVVELVKNHNDSRSIPALNYIADFEIIADEIFILTARPQNGNQYLVKLNSQSETSITYSFPEGHIYGYHMDYNTLTRVIYFTSWSSGVVNSTILP